MNFLGDFEAEFLIDFWVDAVATFEIAEPIFRVGLDGFELVLIRKIATVGSRPKRSSGQGVDITWKFLSTSLREHKVGM